MAQTRQAASKSRASKSVDNPARGKRAKKSPAKSNKFEEGSTRAIRLTFSYDGPSVKLVSQERVEMVIPASDPLSSFRGRKGFWAELRNKQDQTLYRQVLHNPTRNDAEIFPDPEENPEAGISRAPAPKRKGGFVVLVPDTEEGDSVTMCRSPLDKTGPARGNRALASKPAMKFRRFKLKK
jgi:hypothetical protein